jgi:hypothetical protein
MTTVSILPIPDDQGGCTYEAVAGTSHAAGSTPGMALDAITPQLPGGPSKTVVVVHGQQVDHYFTADQQKRLQLLMERWRIARDSGIPISPAEEQELQELVQLEVAAAGARANAIADELHR